MPSRVQSRGRALTYPPAPFPERKGEGLGALNSRGFEVLTPEAAHAGIVSFRHPHASALVRALSGAKVLVEDASQIVRASAHFYNTEDDIDRYVDALTDCAPDTVASLAASEPESPG